MGAILVVDNQRINRDILVNRLSQDEYEILEAENGPEALGLIKLNDVDLVLLDIHMPGMDGYEVLEKIRKNHPATELPIIMVTSESESSSVVKSLGLGADDYVTKPFDMTVLLARIENKLNLSKDVKSNISRQTNDEHLFDIERVRSLIEGGESNSVEFKSTLRFNLHSGQIGNEIEVAWLKTIVAFLNSEGGTLFVGVGDDGKILGTESDYFNSEDKLLLYINNKIKTCIGLEYTKYISFRLIKVDEKKILVVLCRPHSDAVFLKKGNEDESYVRFRLGSRKLSAKEVLMYQRHRN